MKLRLVYPALVILSAATVLPASAQMNPSSPAVAPLPVTGTSATSGSSGMGSVGDQAGGMIGGNVDGSVGQSVGGISANGMSTGTQQGGSGGARGRQPGASGSMLAGHILQGGALPGVRSDRGMSTNSGLKKGISPGGSMSGISVKGLSPAVRAALTAKLAAMEATGGVPMQGGRRTSAQAAPAASMGSGLSSAEGSGSSSANEGAADLAGSPFEHVADPFSLGLEGFGTGAGSSSMGEEDDTTDTSVAKLSSRSSLRSVGSSLGSRSSLHMPLGETSAEARLKRGERRGPNLDLNR